MILLTSCPSSAAPACRSMPCERGARCHARPFALWLLPEWPQRVPWPPRDALPRQPKGARCASHSGTRGPSVRGAAASSAALRSRNSSPRTAHPHRAALQHRSEEHTSELQSPCNLVCRLLLEKKKKEEKTPT